MTGSASPTTMTVGQAADELGVSPARVRALVTAGALPTGPDGLVATTDVAALLERGAVRAVDVAAVEGALDRALKRRLPGLLEGVLAPALAPLSGELATALADVEISTQQLAEAQEATRVAQAELTAARERIAVLEQQVAVLQAQPSGFFRRRRSAVVPA